MVLVPRALSTHGPRACRDEDYGGGQGLFMPESLTWDPAHSKDSANLASGWDGDGGGSDEEEERQRCQVFLGLLW